jgi:hypothetical protein
MSGDMKELEKKLAEGQNIFRRSTVEPIFNELKSVWAEATSLRDTLQIVDRNLLEMTKERDQLHAKLTEYHETFKFIMSEQCPTDEKHCACVPFFRIENAKLNEQKAALREELLRMVETFDGMGSAIPGPAFGSGAIAKARKVLDMTR